MDFFEKEFATLTDAVAYAVNETGEDSADDILSYLQWKTNIGDWEINDMKKKVVIIGDNIKDYAWRYVFDIKEISAILKSLEYGEFLPETNIESNE